MNEDTDHEACATLALAVSIEMANSDDLSETQARNLVERNYLWARGVIERPLVKRIPEPDE